MIDNFYKRILKNLNSRELFYQYYKNKYSYQDLNNFILKFSNIAGFLENKKNKICVLSDKCFELYATTLGIVLTGNIWVPVSSTSPENRVLEIVNELKPDLFILDKVNTLKILRIKNILKKLNIKILTFDEIHSAIPLKKISKLKVKSNDVSMIFFTSGSTGKPKGVKINQKGFVYSLMQQINKLYKNEKKLIFGDYHDISFVISLNILFPCVYIGSTISPGVNTKDILFPIDHAIENNVNTIITVPTTMNRIRNYYKKVSSKFKLKILILCGEPLHYDMFKYLINKKFSKSIFNCYGSTELSPWVFSYKLNKNDNQNIESLNVVPIGNKFKGIILKVIDKILYIGGPTLSSGYLNKAQNKNSFKTINKKVYYKTNDIVEIKNNKYFVLGRSDGIVKISGYRVELFEIDKRIRKLKFVTNSFVFVKEIDEYEKIICACVETKNLKENSIKNSLFKNLPNYMIPKQIKILKKFPVNKNFKVNRVELKKSFFN